MKQSPLWKIAATALATGVIAFLTMLTASTSWDGSLVRAAIATGAAAIVQYVAPLIVPKLDPRLGLLVTSLAIGVTSFLSMLSAYTSWDAATLRAAAAAALAGILQALTPVSSIGLNKPAVPPA